MTDHADVHRNLDHCLHSIAGAREAMADDMNDASMKLGAAAMMLASATAAVHKQAAQLTQVATQPETEGPSGG